MEDSGVGVVGEGPSRPGRWSRFAGFGPIGAMFAGVLGCLWPIGVGGKMPVGGDVTSFSIGLMACLSRAIRAGRLPLWNDLWGYGFPGLAESQMGVFYPPNLILYGALGTEAAYTASLVLHRVWAALGAYWLARKLGIKPGGAALAGFCWAGSGMFLIHLPHHWGDSTASWMPWAWGMAYATLTGPKRVRSALLLAAILAIQVLPGHFQFAFYTEVGVLIIGAWGVVDRAISRKSGAVLIGAAMAAMLPMAAVQLVPTWGLARSAESRRDYGYLSAFASPPSHAVSMVAPNLFHESPLWRSVAWDPFHAMPEEHRLYVGLVPLWLAAGAIRRGMRSDGPTRLLAMLLVASLLMSFGPYLPGFAWLIRLPGFSYFRAPARWGLAASLAMAVLAGKGFDDWRTWPRRGRSAVRFAVVAIAFTVAAVAVVELAFVSTEKAGIPAAADGFEAVRRRLPFAVGRDPTFRQIMASSRSGPSDPLVISGLVREGIDPRRVSVMTLERSRVGIYRRELAETGVILAMILASAPFLARRSRLLLIGLVVLDLGLFSRHQPVESGPIRPLVDQSPVLAKLAAMPHGSRTLGGLKNLPMVAGSGTLMAYRTLDRPALPRLTAMALNGFEGASRAVGASTRVFGPFERAPEDAPGVPDPTLASWGDGRRWAESPGGQKASVYRIRTFDREPAIAWFLPDRDRPHDLFQINDRGEPSRLLGVFERARPAKFHSPAPERIELEVAADGPGLAIVSVLDDPEWECHLSGPGGASVAEVRPIFAEPGGGAWQSVAIPGPGAWRLIFEYRGRAAMRGMAISGLAWLAWVVGLGMSFRSGRASSARGIVRESV